MGREKGVGRGWVEMSASHFQNSWYLHTFIDNIKKIYNKTSKNVFTFIQKKNTHTHKSVYSHTYKYFLDVFCKNLSFKIAMSHCVSERRASSEAEVYLLVNCF